MSVFRESLKRAVPQQFRRTLRFLADPGYRRGLRAAKERQEAVANTQRLVAQSADALWQATCGRVASGPFQGMRYIREAVGSQWAPKLLGTYEKELATVLEQVIARSPSRIIDIGAAEGYYAVGLAWRLPATQVTAFEADKNSHKLLEELASANGVANRMVVRGLCTPAALQAVLGQGEHNVVICDVEGAEVELMDPEAVPALRGADILVELHDWAHPALVELMTRRFGNSHALLEIHTLPRSIADCPGHLNLPAKTALACMDELRPGPMRWLWLTRR